MTGRPLRSIVFGIARRNMVSAVCKDDTGARKTALDQVVDGLIHGFLIGQDRPCSRLGLGHWKPPVVNEESPDAQEGSSAATTVRPSLFHQLPASFSVMIAANDFDQQPTRGILERWSKLTVR